METWETLTMSRKEVVRPGLIRALVAGQFRNRQVAAGLHLSVRQVQRLKRRFRAAGVAGLVHRTRGQPSRRRLAPAVRQRVADLMRTVYEGLNDCHLTEKLREVEGLTLCRESVRRIRQTLGRPAKQPRRSPRHRRRRLPEARAGSLVLLDGSPAAWLEARGPTMTLHGALDDAGGEVLALHFRPTEDLHGYAVVLEAVFTTRGLPVACYGDGTNILVRNDPHWSLDEELRGVQDPTHLGRVLAELGIGYIRARSPQAKGRIERLWRTLQDRLIAELRLRGIATRDAANAFLPRFIADYNRRFAHPPADPIPAWRRPPRDLPVRLSCRYTRTVARDNTAHLGPRWLQLPPGPGGRSWAGCRVELRECLDGRLVALYAGRVLADQPSPGADFVLRPRSDPTRERPQRLRASRSPSEEGGRSLPLPPNGASAPVPPCPAPAPPQRRPARQHPWRRLFSRRERARQRAVTGTPQGG
jgi:transposase